MAAANLTALVPSSADLLMAFPRLGSHIAGIFGLSWDAFGAFANDTNVSTILTPAAVAGRAFAQSTSSPASPAAALAADLPGSGLLEQMEHILQRLASFDGVFSYVASRWALSTLILSIVLNRAHVYASSREHLQLTWQARLFLRSVPLALLCYQTLRIMQTIRCQTGFQLPQIRFNKSDSVINRSWVQGNRAVYTLISGAIFWEDVQDSCRAVNMIPSGDGGPAAWQGSTMLLWPLFVTLSFSQFIETISSALQGRQPRPETGMTMFEHSMAFAEAETITRTAVGLGLFGLPTSTTSPPNADRVESGTNPGSNFTFTRAMLLNRLNVPPEVLLISLISACSHIASHALGILGWQARYRLANTTTWGVLYLTLFVYSFVNYAQNSDAQEMQKIRYPTVCIIGYLPHLLIVMGIALCSVIYSSAIICTLLSAPTHWSELPFWERVKLAHSNMSASVSLSNIRIRATEDFYTVLLKAGYYVMSAATEAVYFNEGVQVTLKSSTWLDRAYLVDAKLARGRLTQIPLELQEGFAGGEGFGLTDEEPQAGPDGNALPSGYAIERKTMKKLNKTSVAALKEEGVGISQRSGRWFISWKLLEQIASLLGYFLARFAVSMMENLGGARPPRWMLRLARVHGAPYAPLDPSSKHKTVDFWMISESGDLMLPTDRNVDVEAETRKRLELGLDADTSNLDSTLYSWWKHGGWWGDVDESGEYQPDTNEDDDDTTSVISEASSAWETASAASSSSDRSGAQTPTQVTVTARSTVVDADGAAAHLVRLLDPKTLSDKQEARMLAHRLRPHDSPSGAMTRSQYRRSLLRDRCSPDSGRSTGPLSETDEELVLSGLISSRRPGADDGAPTERRQSLAWEQGGDGMGSSGPQCAICHSAPRTVLVWPCRCLSLCEECRMSLAVNNFGSCVCCRRDVVAFSRLFVP